MRTLVVCHRWSRERSESGLVRALESVLGAERHSIEDGWPPPSGLQKFDSVLVFVRFRELAVRPPLDWGRFDGQRVMLEHDAYLNFVEIGTNPYRGRWPPEFHRHRFDLMIASGRVVAERLAEEGVPTSWVPKGYDDASFRNQDGHRAGRCTYGTRYRARAAMMRRLTRERLEFVYVTSPYEGLDAELNRYVTCLVCNMHGTPRFGILGRALNRRQPGALMKLRPGSEPMIKNFEAAASGCAVVADHLPELADLGFVDGETFVGYRDFDELVDKLRWYDDERLRPIGRAGASLCATRHTWGHRAHAVGTVLSARP